jgi:hypothetical protein
MAKHPGIAIKLQYCTSQMADDYSNIFTAAGDGRLDLVQGFVQSGVSVNAQDESGYSAL